MSRIFVQLWTKYLYALKHHPMKVQAMQTGILMGTGDIVAQKLIEGKDLEWRRTIRFSILGSTFVGPCIRIWYTSLEKIVGAQITLSSVLAKVALDQLAFSPCMHICILTYVGLMQSHSWAQIEASIREKWFTIVKTGWKIWPVALIFNFYFIPLLLRPLTVSIVAVFWHTFLAWKANSNTHLPVTKRL